MATELPLTFRASPLPSNFAGTPQQFLDALVARLAVDTQDALALFSASATTPTSDVGPWLNGQTWYVWNSGTGAYIPEVLLPSQLKYIASTTAPDPAVYTLWIELNGAGKALTIQYYSGGAWHSVYEDSFLAVVAANTINSDAIAAKVSYPFRASKILSAQPVTGNAAAVVVVFENEDFDSGGNYASNKFTAPVSGFYQFSAAVYFTIGAGAITDIEPQLKLRRNTADISNVTGFIQPTDPFSSSIEIHDTVSLTAGDQVDVTFEVGDTGNGTYSIVQGGQTTHFSGSKLIT